MSDFGDIMTYAAGAFLFIATVIAVLALAAAFGLGWWIGGH